MTAIGKFKLPSLAALLALGACVSMPTGPTVPVLPGSGKNFNQFRADDAMCQRYALEQIGETLPELAAIGTSARSPAPSLAAGAATSAATAEKKGAAVGAGTARASAYDLQRRYDLGYIQCMYAQGHRVPVLGPMAMHPAQTPNPLPPPSSVPR